MSTDAGPQESTTAGGGSPPPRDSIARPGPQTVALVAGLVAILGALLLPFAPVSVSEPHVRWPVDPCAPAPTMLMLTAYEPLDLEARFSCRVARAAAATPDGLVLSTMAPSSPDVDTEALTVRARDGGLTIRSSGEDLFAGPLPPGDCSFVVRGDARVTTVRVDGAVVSTTPTRMPEVDPEVRPESEPDPEPITALPEVDALTTSVRSIPGGGPDDLSVRMTVDDVFNSTPAPAKAALIVVMVVALVVGGLAMIVLARRTGPARAPPRGTPSARAVRWVRGRRPRVVDVVVPAVIVAWMFLAPMTDDDGYYSAMAANVPFSGYVPNYYQLLNQGYTPFSWPYYVLSWWQTTFGVAPVVLRVPAALLGIGTWFLARAFVARAGAGTGGRWTGAALRVALAAAFLGWWLPYDMGVRPEPVIAFFAVAALVAVAEGLERRRLVLIGAAAGLGSVGLMAAPTGFVALAPLVAAAPAVWRLLRDGSATRWRAAGRWVVVLAPGAVGSLLGFADGAYRDFVRSQEIFASIQRASTWFNELTRYALLLDTGTHFGSYARRAAVLVGLLAVVWFVALAVAARARDLAVPSRLLLAGWTTVLAFVLLLPTPSKPTHHFGALAGLGAAFLALVLVTGPRLVADLTAGRRVPYPALVAAATSAVLVFALAGHGRDLWPFAWGLGMPAYGDYPSVRGVEFDRPLLWAAGTVVVAAAVAGWAWRRSPGWRRLALAVAVPVMVCVFLVTTTVWMVGDFARAAVRTSQTWSPQADAWADPLATRCGAPQQVDVLDAATTRALPPALLPGQPPPPAPVPAAAPGAPPPQERPEPFLPGAWFPNSPPPAGLPPGVTVWGSFLVPGPGASADARVGRFTTGWFRVPPPSPGTDPTVLVSGRIGDGTSLRVEYGRASPRGFTPLGSRPVGEGDDSPSWRPVALVGEAAPPPGADAMRLVASDEATTTGGWLAFSAPVERRWVPLQQYLPPNGAVGVAWQLKFLFPCQRQPRQELGVTEPAVAAIGYGSTPEAALAGWPFDPERGGVMGHAAREARVTTLTTRFRDFPEVDEPDGGVDVDEVDDVHVFDFRQPFPAGRYELTPDRRTVSGLPAADPLEATAADPPWPGRTGG